MKYLFFLLLILPSLSFTYSWQSIGPNDIEANNFYVWGGGIAYEIICTSNGMLVNINNNWQEFSYGSLPIWDVEAVVLGIADLLAVMGDGTDSDGIYYFNFSNNEFLINRYFANPRFIEYLPSDNHYYVGGEEGLIKSELGTNWETVEFFNGKYCYDMVSYESNYVVSTDSGVYYSNDSGENWYSANTMVYLNDLVFSSTGILYGIFPDESWSSGLWSSVDYGLNWITEFWSTNMSSAGFDCDNNLFIGWEEPNSEHEGIAIWTPDIWDLTFLNDGLENTNINMITTHPLINCINVLACTDSGVYLLSNYQTETKSELLIKNFELSNYPNPFNPSTTISFSLTTENSENAELIIYNLKGQKIRQYSILDNQSSIIWNGRDENRNTVSSGVYLYKLKSGKYTASKKMILMK